MPGLRLGVPAISSSKATYPKNSPEQWSEARHKLGVFVKLSDIDVERRSQLQEQAVQLLRLRPEHLLDRAYESAGACTEHELGIVYEER